MGLDKSLLSRMANARATKGGGAFVQHGKYVFIVRNFEISQGFNGIAVILELYVKSSVRAPDGKMSEAPHNPAGSTCKVVYKLTGGGKAEEAAHSNLKALVQDGLLGKANYDALMASSELGKDASDRYGELLSRLQANARGLEMVDETWLGTIQSGPNAGKSIVNHRWTHVSISDDAQAANCKMLDTNTELEGDHATDSVAESEIPF